MILIGIDPSFSRTGLAIGNPDSSDWQLYSITKNGNQKNIVLDMENAYNIVKEIKNIVIPFIESGESILWGIEYPILATVAGAYLSFITSKIDSFLRLKKQSQVYFLPSIAVACFTKARTKSDLMDWVKSSGFITSPSKYNHDEATAVVLSKIALQSKEGIYKKSYLFRDYSKELIIKEQKHGSK